MYGKNQVRGQGRRLTICNTLVSLGRVYAAYDGMFIVLSLLRGWMMDGIKPDRFDIMAAAILSHTLLLAGRLREKLF